MTDSALITEVEVLVDQGAQPNMDNAFISVHSAEQTGWYGPVSLSVAKQVVDGLGGLVVGKDCRSHTSNHELLRVAGSRQRDADTSWAVGSLDCAMWDLHGRLEGCSVAELLSDSRPVSHVAAYGSWLRLDLTKPNLEETVMGVERQGWSFLKWGIRAQAPDDGALLASLATRVGTLCASPPALDAVRTWDLATARAFASEVEAGRFRWIEDPFQQDSLDYRHIPSSLPPLVCGETVSSIDELNRLIEFARPAALALDVVGLGGVTPFLHAIRMGRHHNLTIFPHGRSLMPAIQLAASHTDAISEVEYQLQWEPSRQRLYLQAVQPTGGKLEVPTVGMGTVPRVAAQ
jgi:L-alanine-DL-glutamate epimerase-like enolase superfamily enzyme